MDRVEHCMDLYKRCITPEIRNELVLCLDRAKERAKNTVLDLHDGMTGRGFSYKMIFLLDEEIMKSIAIGKLPGVARIAPDKARRSSYPDYVIGGLSLQINKVSKSGAFPRIARMRENRRDKSQANLFPDEMLTECGYQPDPLEIGDYTYANFVYCADPVHGIRSAYIGFPKNSQEGRGWIFPAIDLLNVVEYIKPVSDNNTMLKEPQLKKDVVKLNAEKAS